MIRRWDIITIGNLSRNRYWGEADDKPLRKALCTSTLVAGEGFRLLVDPPIGEADRMAAELDRRSGLKPADVNCVFITHEHGDHHAGLANFPQADWFAAKDAAAAINRSGRYSKKVHDAPATLHGALDVLATPGHAASHHSLRFDCGGMCVVIAGDAVMTRDFWADRLGFHNSTDFAQAARTMDMLADIANAIVPGHDNWFLVGNKPPLPSEGR